MADALLRLGTLDLGDPEMCKPRLTERRTGSNQLAGNQVDLLGRQRNSLLARVTKSESPFEVMGHKFWIQNPISQLNLLWPAATGSQ